MVGDKEISSHACLLNSPLALISRQLCQVGHTLEIAAMRSLDKGIS